MPKISIVIPTYNAEKTIEATLQSIKENENLNDFICTIYIADDHSKDNTLEICEKFSIHMQTPVEILPAKRNLGERGNLNRLIQTPFIVNDWMLLIHADDLAKPNWVKTMCAYIYEHPEYASVCSSYDVLYDNGKIIAGDNTNQNEIIEGNTRSINSTLVKGTWWHISGCAINLKVWKKSGLFNKNMPQYGDMEWLLRILNQGETVMYIAQLLTLYRQSEQSVSSNSFKTHQDIFEYSNLVIHYQNLVPNEAKHQLFLRFQKDLTKRFLKSLIKGNWKRAFSALNRILYLINLFIFIKKPDPKLELNLL